MLVKRSVADCPLRILGSEMRMRIEELVGVKRAESDLDNALWAAVLILDMYIYYEPAEDGLFSAKLEERLRKKAGLPPRKKFELRELFREYGEYLQNLLDGNSEYAEIGIDLLVLFDLYMRNHNSDYASPLTTDVLNTRIRKKIARFAREGIRVPA